MKTLLLFLLTVVLAAAQSAKTQVARLDLLDGRTLRNVRAASYDPETERVLVLASGKAQLVPLALIPPPFKERFSTALPRAGASTSVTATRSIVSVDRPMPSPTIPSDPFATMTPEQMALAETAERHAEAARTRAERYFEFELQPGSGASAVTRLDIELEQPEPVSGWSQRYRTKGKAYLSFYDSRGGSFQSKTAEFEVLTEQKLGEAVKVLDFTRTR